MGFREVSGETGDVGKKATYLVVTSAYEVTCADRRSIDGEF